MLRLLGSRLVRCLGFSVEECLFDLSKYVLLTCIFFKIKKLYEIIFFLIFHLIFFQQSALLSYRIKK